MPDRHKVKMFGLRLPEPHMDILRQIAKKNRRSLTEEIKMALEAYAEKNGLPVPKSIADTSE